MKKEDLRKAFGKIKPSDALIDETLMLLRTGEKRSERRERITFSFTYRLAGAMCAFAIMVVVGITFGKDIILSPAEDTPGTYGRDAFNNVEAFRPNSAPAGMEADMLVDATEKEELNESELNAKKTLAVAELVSKGESLGERWTVVYGTLDGCYFVSDSCVAAISVIENCGGAELGLSDNTLIAEIQLEDGAGESDISDAVGSFVCLLVADGSDVESVSYKIADCDVLK